MEKYRFFVLLGALVALFVVGPLWPEFIPGTGPALSRALMTGLFVSMVLSAVFAVARTRWSSAIAALLAVPLVLFALLQNVFHNDAVDIPAHLLGVAFLGYALWVIVRFLFVVDRVDANTICAAICVYLLLGVFWALLLSAVAVKDADAFNTSLRGGQPAVRFWDKQSGDALYFSLVSLTTLGFGDITPASPLSKMLVALKALTGQLFLAILVARLVGLYIIHSTNKQPADDQR